MDLSALLAKRGAPFSAIARANEIISRGDFGVPRGWGVEVALDGLAVLACLASSTLTLLFELISGAELIRTSTLADGQKVSTIRVVSKEKIVKGACFVVLHVWSGTATQVSTLSFPKLVDAWQNENEISSNDPTLDLVKKHAFDDLWRHVDHVFNNDLLALSEPSFLALRHSDRSPLDMIVLDDATIVWTVTEIDEGQEITRNYLPTATTVQRAARLIARFPTAQFWAIQEEFAFYSNAALTVQQQALEYPVPSPHHSTSPDPALTPEAPVLVYSTYPNINADNVTLPGFVFVSELEKANIAFLALPVKDFSTVSRAIVNQFPYESCIIRKDLLPITVRGYSNHTQQSSSWLPPTYDLRTQAAAFIGDYHERVSSAAHNTWVVKPAQESRTQGIFFSRNISQILRSTETLEKDHVVQLEIERPLLLQGTKFDIRAFVVVKSYHPFEVYMHQNIYARRATKPLKEASSLDDLDAHLTVAKSVSWIYAPGSTVLHVQEVFSPEQLKDEVTKAGQDFAKLHRNVAHMLAATFRCASGVVGAWPNSRAVHAVDLMIDEALNAYLLEVNFAPDFTSPLKRVADGYPNFINGLLRVTEKN